MTDEEFVDWWSSLKNSLDPHTPIPRWSVTRGYQDSFIASVGAISPECIVVEKRGIYQRMIFTGDFRRVLDLWDDYRNGIISRKRIDGVTKHGTYVLSIIRWLEDKGKVHPS